MGFRLKPPRWGTNSSVAPVLDAPDDASVPSTGYSSAREGASVVPFASKANKQTQDKAASQGNQGNTVNANTFTSNNKAAIAAQQNPARPENIPPQKAGPIPAPQARQAEQTAPPAPALENLPQVSYKITKVNASKKVIDFNDKLVMARIEDYANIHGVGGKDHNGNSTIGVVICDYSKGTGDKAVSMKYNIDVDDIALLNQAAMNARLGLLRTASSVDSKWIDNCLSIVNGWAKFPAAQDGTRPIHRNDLTALRNILNNAKAQTKSVAGTPVFQYAREKNNPYQKTVDGFAPVSRIEINYTPYRQDGAESNYPWYIAIKNFEAPVKTSSSGANQHMSSQARNLRSAFINLSADDFCAAMNSIDRFIRLWEYRALPMMNQAYKVRELRRQNNNKN